MKGSGQGQKSTVSWYIIKFSEISKDKHWKDDLYYIMFLKWKGVERDRTLHLLDLNWTVDCSRHS